MEKITFVNKTIKINADVFDLIAGKQKRDDETISVTVAKIDDKFAITDGSIAACILNKVDDLLVGDILILNKDGEVVREKLKTRKVEKSGSGCTLDSLKELL